LLLGRVEANAASQFCGNAIQEADARILLDSRAAYAAFDVDIEAIRVPLRTLGRQLAILLEAREPASRRLEQAERTLTQATRRWQVATLGPLADLALALDHFSD
jgi:hypothetical protein